MIPFMNVYDFDGTLYDGDSTFDFIRYLMGKYPRLIARVFPIGLDFLCYKCGRFDKTTFKERMYAMFTLVPDVEGEVALFWEKNLTKIMPYYSETRKPDDLVISASPEFIVIPACRAIGIEKVMASQVDPKTGKYTGINCHGAEKIRRMQERYPDAVVEDFYSDSHADDPLAKIAKRAFMVRKNRVFPWPGFKK